MTARQTPFFIGISLPDTLNEQIYSLKRYMQNEIDHALKPLVPHITLLHPSSLRTVSPDILLPDIRNMAIPYLPLYVTLDLIEDFGREVLYIRALSPELEELQAKLVRLLPSASQEIYHQRGFIPHVTLAQVRKPYSLDIEALRNHASQEISLPTQFTADTISYFTQTAPREYQAHHI